MKATIIAASIQKSGYAKLLRTLPALFVVVVAISLLRPALAEPPASPYVIGADDVLSITVTNHEDLNTTVTVRQDGTIAFPEIGDVSAGGKTPKELAEALKAELEKTRNRVAVMVSVKEVHSLRVRIIGGVRSPGLFDLKANWRLMDLILAAGGLSKPGSVSGRLVRRGESIPLDLEQAATRPESQANFLLERDDLAILADKEAAVGHVYVMGQVGRIGSYELTADTTALSLLSQAGNPTERAILSAAYVLRAGKRIPLNLVPTYHGESDPAVAQFKFLPDDILYLPEFTSRYSVMGGVGKPGYFPLLQNGDVTVIDALNQSGGAANGNPKKAAILRKVNGKVTVIPVNIDQIVKKGDLSKNVSLQANDILFIPPKSGRTFNQIIGDVLTPLSLLTFLGFHL